MQNLNFVRSGISLKPKQPVKAVKTVKTTWKAKNRLIVERERVHTAAAAINNPLFVKTA
jgi:hypothetical protein